MDHVAFSSEVVKQFGLPEGTFEFTYRFAQPPAGPPSTEAVFFEIQSEGITSRLSVDPGGIACFTRTESSGRARSVELDVNELLGAGGWFIAASWADDRLLLHIGDVEKVVGLRSAENTAPAG